MVCEEIFCLKKKKKKEVKKIVKIKIFFFYIFRKDLRNPDLETFETKHESLKIKIRVDKIGKLLPNIPQDFLFISERLSEKLAQMRVFDLEKRIIKRFFGVLRFRRLGILGRQCLKFGTEHFRKRIKLWSISARIGRNKILFFEVFKQIFCGIICFFVFFFFLARKFHVFGLFVVFGVMYFWFQCHMLFLEVLYFHYQQHFDQISPTV